MCQQIIKKLVNRKDNISKEIIKHFVWLRDDEENVSTLKETLREITEVMVLIDE
jgi:bacterioferritin (cytochrome b1)